MLLAAVTARALKRESGGLEDNTGQEQPCSSQQRNHQQQPGSSASCDPGAVGTSGRDADVVMDGTAAAGSTRQGKAGGKKGQKAAGLGSQSRKYTLLEKRPMEHSVDSRLQKHGLIMTDKGFGRPDEDED